MPFTDDYYRALDESKTFHQTHKTYSGSLAIPHADHIFDLLDRVHADAVLDYGSGKGLQYQAPYIIDKCWGVPVTKYDPAWPEFAQEPTGTFDVVICTHTLGAIPVTDVPAVVDRLYALATKAIYVGEIIGPVKKRVFSRPDLHPIGWSAQQWRDALRRQGSPVEMILALKTPEDDDFTVEQISNE